MTEISNFQFGTVPSAFQKITVWPACPLAEAAVVSKYKVLPARKVLMSALYWTASGTIMHGTWKIKDNMLCA